MPLPGHPIRCPYPIDLTDADFSPKGALQFSLDTTGSYLRVVGTKLDHPQAYGLRQFVGMPVAIIQENHRRFVFINLAVRSGWSFIPCVRPFSEIGQSSRPHCTIRSYPSLDAQR